MAEPGKHKDALKGTTALDCEPCDIIEGLGADADGGSVGTKSRLAEEPWLAHLQRRLAEEGFKEADSTSSRPNDARTGARSDVFNNSVINNGRAVGAGPRQAPVRSSNRAYASSNCSSIIPYSRSAPGMTKKSGPRTLPIAPNDSDGKLNRRGFAASGDKTPLIDYLNDSLSDTAAPQGAGIVNSRSTSVTWRNSSPWPSVTNARDPYYPNKGLYTDPVALGDTNSRAATPMLSAGPGAFSQQTHAWSRLDINTKDEALRSSSAHNTDYAVSISTKHCQPPACRQPTARLASSSAETYASLNREGSPDVIDIEIPEDSSLSRNASLGGDEPRLASTAFEFVYGTSQKGRSPESAGPSAERGPAASLSWRLRGLRTQMQQHAEATAMEYTERYRALNQRIAQGQELAAKLYHMLQVEAKHRAATEKEIAARIAEHIGRRIMPIDPLTIDDFDGGSPGTRIAPVSASGVRDLLNVNNTGNNDAAAAMTHYNSGTVSQLLRAHGQGPAYPKTSLAAEVDAELTEVEGQFLLLEQRCEKMLKTLQKGEQQANQKKTDLNMILDQARERQASFYESLSRCRDARLMLEVKYANDLKEELVAASAAVDALVAQRSGSLAWAGPRASELGESTLQRALNSPFAYSSPNNRRDDGDSDRRQGPRRKAPSQTTVRGALQALARILVEYSQERRENHSAIRLAAAKVRERCAYV